MELHILTPSQSIEAGSYSYVDSFESIARPVGTQSCYSQLHKGKLMECIRATLPHPYGGHDTRTQCTRRPRRIGRRYPVAAQCLQARRVAAALVHRTVSTGT
jgi:hypothetical protein